MVEPINLNKARKGKAKADEKARAQVNRVAHGRTRRERELAEAERLRLGRVLDGARRETDPD